MALLRQLFFCCYRDPDLFVAKNRARRSAPATATASALAEEETKDLDPPLENGNQKPDLVTSHEQPHHSPTLSEEGSSEAIPYIKVQVTHSELPKDEIVEHHVIRHAPVDEEPIVQEKRELKSPSLQTVSISLAPTVMKPLAVDTTSEPSRAADTPTFLNTGEQQVRNKSPRRSGRSLFVIRHKSRTDTEVEKDENKADKSDDVDKVLLVQAALEDDRRRSSISSSSPGSENFETSDDLTYCVTPSDKV